MQSTLQSHPGQSQPSSSGGTESEKEMIKVKKEQIETRTGNNKLQKKQESKLTATIRSWFGHTVIL